MSLAFLFNFIHGYCFLVFLWVGCCPFIPVRICEDGQITTPFPFTAVLPLCSTARHFYLDVFYYQLENSIYKSKHIILIIQFALFFVPTDDDVIFFITDSEALVWDEVFHFSLASSFYPVMKSEGFSLSPCVYIPFLWLYIWSSKILY